MLTMISAAPMMKYWGTSQNTLMGTGSVLVYRSMRRTWPRRTTSTMAATTIDMVEICSHQAESVSVAQPRRPEQHGLAPCQARLTGQGLCWMKAFVCWALPRRDTFTVAAACTR